MIKAFGGGKGFQQWGAHQLRRHMGGTLARCKEIEEGPFKGVIENWSFEKRRSLEDK